MISILILSSLLVTKSSVKIAHDWDLTKHLSNPESVYLEPTEKVIYISNVSGSPTAKDSKGWISKVSTQGEIIQEKWADGLDAPKGLRAFQGKLWVTNIDEVLSYDLKTAKRVDRIAVPGSQFLNDIAIDSSGTVYVSDTLGSAIYKISQAKASLWMKGSRLEAPNGLLIDGDRLVVAAWGMPEADWSTKVPGHLYAIDLKTKKKKLITAKSLGNLDGLEKDTSGHFWVSDWMAGKVYRVDEKTGQSLLILENLKNPADIGWINDSQQLLVPLMGADQLLTYHIK